MGGRQGAADILNDGPPLGALAVLVQAMGLRKSVQQGIDLRDCQRWLSGASVFQDDVESPGKVPGQLETQSWRYANESQSWRYANESLGTNENGLVLEANHRKVQSMIY